MLRSNFEPGTTRWAVRRAQWRAMGLSDRDMSRPKVAVVNSSSGLSSCYQHLDELSRVVQRAIRAAGGVPFEIHTAAPSDFVTSAGREARYLMPARDLIVCDIEVMVEGALLDGMVCLASCDKTTPAQLMAAARLDVPAILVVGGYQMGGTCAGRHVDIDDVYESVGAVARGATTLSALTAMTEVAVGGPGVCAGLGTANTMHIVAEALGMTMPGSAPVRAGSERMTELATAAGRRAVQLVAEDLRPRTVLTEAALRNAAAVACAVGGSVNAVRHLAAVATEAELDVDVVAMFEEISARTPLLCAVRPNGPHRTEDLEAAGGARAVMAALGDRLDLCAATVSGHRLHELLAPPPADDSVIHRPERPVAARGMAILRGSIAPEGAIVKLSALSTDVERFAGPARVFGGEGAAIEALAAGAIEPGEVVVLRGMGPRGGPGTVFAAGFVAALAGAGLSEQVAVVTDGELSGLNRGITVGQVMPEAADGGPLAVVHDEDTIAIDLRANRLDLLLSDEELEGRLARHVGALPAAPRGWLATYRSVVQPMRTGAVLGAADNQRP